MVGIETPKPEKWPTFCQPYFTRQQSFGGEIGDVIRQDIIWIQYDLWRMPSLNELTWYAGPSTARVLYTYLDMIVNVIQLLLISAHFSERRLE